MSGIQPATEERRQQVLAMRREGLSNADIGRALGVTRQCIEQFIHRERLLRHQRDRYRRNRSLTAAQPQAPDARAG